MDYLMMLASIVLFASQTIAFKEFNRSQMKNLGSYFFFNFLYFDIVVGIFLLLNTHPEGIHTSTAILAVMFGVFFVAMILMYMKTMEIGPLSYSSLLFSIGLLVPILFGVFFWKEHFGVVQLAGLVLLFFTFYLGSSSSSDSKSKINIRWFVYGTIALLLNGSVMVLAKMQQLATPGKEIKEFLILGFGTASLLSLILFLRQRFLSGERISHLKNRSFMLVVLAAGITTAFGNQLQLYIASRVPAVVQFPTVNGGVVFLSSIFSMLIFKEKLTRKSIFGLILGIAALVLLSIR